MTKDSPARAFLVVLVVAVVSSALVSSAVVVLRPIQLNNALLDRAKNIMQLTGLLPQGESPGDEEMLELFKSLDARIVDIDAAGFNAEINPDTFDERKAAASAEFSVAVPADLDLARLGRRSRYAITYLVWKNGQFDRLILPIHGAGMWSMLYGYVALEADLNTIAAATFYEQRETPGLGDQVTRPDWLEQWQGRQIYNAQGEFAFGIGPGRIEPGSVRAQFRVDALTGATVTSDAVSSLLHYWFGPHGYQPFLKTLREQPRNPEQPGGGSSMMRQPLLSPLLKENPVTVHVLGVCSALAITNSLTSSVIMSVALTVVLVISNVVISLIRKNLPGSVRIIVQITVIASAVTIIDQFLRAFMPDAAKTLTVYISLIVTNCIVLGRAEACAMKNGVPFSVADAIGNGLGYSIVLIGVATIRELFGSGTLFGQTILKLQRDGGWFHPNEMMLLPPSAFLIIGLMVWAIRSWKPEQAEKKELEPIPLAKELEPVPLAKKEAA